MSNDLSRVGEGDGGASFIVVVQSLEVNGGFVEVDLGEGLR